MATASKQVKQSKKKNMSIVCIRWKRLVDRLLDIIDEICGNATLTYRLKGKFSLETKKGKRINHIKMNRCTKIQMKTKAYHCIEI